ncbi:MAG: PEGA domain-containing protein [Treponema sp.]
MSMKKCLLLFVAISCVLTGSAEEKPEPTWLLAAAPFSLINVPDIYASYASGVPAMLSTFCTAPSMRRLVSADEKKTQYTTEMARKKLILIKERAALIKERDALYLSMLTPSEQKTKATAFNKDITAKEEEIEKIQKKLDSPQEEGTTFSDEVLPIRFWKDGAVLFEQPEHTNLEPALRAEKISAIIEGSIENLAGYMYITVHLRSSLPGMPVATFSEAGSYQAVESIAQSLARQIVDTITNTKLIKVNLAVEPADAKVFIGDRQLETTEKTFYVHEGSYRVEAAAPDYETAYKTIDAHANTEYQLQIKLKPEKKAAIGFPFTTPATDIFLHTQYFGKNPTEATIPAKKQTVFTFSYNDVKTYVLVHPNVFTQRDESLYTLTAPLNQVQTKMIIEKRRNILYWSLAAFYISLPVSILLQGITTDMGAAIAAHKIAESGAYKALSITTLVMQGITAGLGINYAVQLGFYFYAADQSIPKEASYKQ